MLVSGLFLAFASCCLDSELSVKLNIQSLGFIKLFFDLLVRFSISFCQFLNLFVFTYFRIIFHLDVSTIYLPVYICFGVFFLNVFYVFKGAVTESVSFLGSTLCLMVD